MIVNTNPTTNIRYGVIACNSLDDDLVNHLFYGSQAKNLSEEEAMADAKEDAEKQADDIEEEAYDSARDRFDARFGHPPFTTIDHQLVAELHEAEIDACYEHHGFSGRDDFIEHHASTEGLEIAEPTIEGEHEGVKYRIAWLGGAPLLWVLDGPLGYCDRLCSPCVPNAADLDSGFIGQTREATPARYHDRILQTLQEGSLCYVVPPDWPRKEDE